MEFDIKAGISTFKVNYASPFLLKYFAKNLKIFSIIHLISKIISNITIFEKKSQIFDANQPKVQKLKVRTEENTPPNPQKVVSTAFNPFSSLSSPFLSLNITKIG